MSLDDADRTWVEEKLHQTEERLEVKLHQTEERLEEKLHQTEERLEEKLHQTEERLIEVMRGMQTELLRGFASFSESQTLRLRKVEADQSNLDASISGRVAVLERRLLEIEQRLHIQPPNPPQ